MRGGFGTYQIAVRENDVSVRESQCRICGEILEDADIPHGVTPFAGSEALESALAASARFDLLCLSILMDGKTGTEFAASPGRGIKKQHSLYYQQ